MASSNKPTNKVGSAALAGALSTIGVYAYDHLTHDPLPAVVASAVTVVIMFAVGYIVPDGGGDDPPPNPAPEPEELA